MGAYPDPNVSYFLEDPHLGEHHQVPVKTEASSSPDLSPASTSLQHFQFKFNPQTQPSHASLPQSRNPSESPSCLPPQPIYRFGSDPGPYNLASEQAWPPSGVSHHLSSRHSLNFSQQHINGHNNHHPEYFRPAMSYSDEYDNVSDLAELADHPHANYGSSGGLSHEKTIRRRSSKACDQCRKSKCKCERSSPNEPCKSCIMLGTPCTFLGPSRKRGPPKGYIDAIEARLHQTEALIGIMLSTKDPRARSLLDDISKDTLAKEIINRVDNSPYGVKGRKRDSAGVNGKARAATSSNSDCSTQKDDMGKVDLTSTHPSNEWQDRVTAMLNAAAGVEADQSDAAGQDVDDGESTGTSSPLRSPLHIQPSRPAALEIPSSDENQSPARRQRRRVGDHQFSAHTGALPHSDSTNGSSASLHPGQTSTRRRSRGFSHTYSSLSPAYSLNRERGSSRFDSLSSDSEDELLGAVGQLSLNEDEQVRYHGKASGLHILNNKERVDGRNEGGIWRFPKARVWPPVPTSIALPEEDEFVTQLPNESVQERLLDFYFLYVHPAFPVIHKRSFFDIYKNSHQSPASASESDCSSGPVGLNRRPRRIPALLLLAMFALAARYDDSAPLPPDSSLMWSAGDEYLDRAKVILDQSYASSRPSTCQALLLMGYREVGIGAMAQAWTYIGMAIRMAQDLGMHRSADGWARIVLGGRLFNESELHERKRIWYGCVIMDKYVSTYIGRPLMIFERDFDTPLPGEDDAEELENWSYQALTDHHSSVPCHVISCFNASATLSGILSTIVQAIYAVRPVSSRYAESLVLEALLDKWYLELPEHLRYDSNSTNKSTLLPHVLTLHMQYWCAVLLLHRPFIRSVYNGKPRSDESDDPEILAIATKNYELCAGAANHITSIVSAYAEKYPLNRCSVFLCYYLFTASIMHITILTSYPSDPQARLGLKKCTDALEMMETVWPSAARALQLLRGATVSINESEFVSQSNSVARHKRTAEHSLDDSEELNRRYFSSQVDGQADYIPSTRPQIQPNYVYPHTDGYAGHTSSNQAHASTLSPLSAASPTNYRWHSEDFHPHHSFNSNAPLSTSVLPQLYSTGFGDDRAHAAHARVHSHPDHHQAASHRYPQYWNDYSTFPQIGQAYGSMHEPPVPHQPVNSQMYIPEHYNIYNQQPFSNR